MAKVEKETAIEKKSKKETAIEKKSKKDKLNIESVTPLNEVVKKNLKVTKEDIIEIKIKKDGFYVTPTYAHDGDVGLDVTATGIEYKEDIDTYVYHTGLYVESMKGIGCFLLPRSSNRKTDAYIPNSPGLADTFTYRGELCFSFKNRTDIDVTAAIIALNKISHAPWWKRLFMKFNEEWQDAANELRKTPIILAPYEVGDKIGQLVFFKHSTVKFVEVDELSNTSRGEGGFGSTGK